MAKRMTMARVFSEWKQMKLDGWKASIADGGTIYLTPPPDTEEDIPRRVKNFENCCCPATGLCLSITEIFFDMERDEDAARFMRMPIDLLVIIVGASLSSLEFLRSPDLPYCPEKERVRKEIFAIFDLPLEQL